MTSSSDVRDIKEDKPALNDHKIINGTKYPVARWANTTRALLNRALVDVLWTPEKSGCYRLEAELQPSKDYAIGRGLARAAIAVSS